MDISTNSTGPAKAGTPNERAEALAAYQACKTDDQRAALYWKTPALREVISEVTHPKPAGE